MNVASSGARRIAIIGSCQVSIMEQAARVLVPNASISSWHVGAHRDTESEIAAQMPGFDLVISQVDEHDPNSPLAPQALKEAGANLLCQPVLVFPGFHPDCTYLFTPTGVLRGACCDYHSVIAVAGFHLGLDVRRACRLYNTLVLTELGCLAVFEWAQRALIENFAAAGFAIAPMIERWMADGRPYMYTINHPSALAIATLTHAALLKAEFISDDTPVPADLPDQLARYFIWPVYPPIARRIGITGSTTFLRGVHGLADGEARELPLEAFVERSFAIYRGVDPTLLRNTTIDAAVARLEAIL